MPFSNRWFYQYNEQNNGEGSDLGGAGDKSGDNEGSNQNTGDKSDKSGDAGDKGKPSDAEAVLLKDVMKWKGKAQDADAKISTLNDEIANLKASSTELQTALGGLDVEAIKALVKQQKDAEVADLEKKGDYDRIVAQMKDENEREIQKYEAKTTELAGQIEELQKQLDGRAQEIEQMTVGRSFSESEFIREQSVLPASVARREFGSNFEYEDGQIVGYDKPAGEKDRTKLVDGAGRPLSFDEALTRLYERHPDSKSLVRSKAKPGAGSTTETQTGNTSDSTPLSGVEKIRLGLQGKK